MNENLQAYCKFNVWFKIDTAEMGVVWELVDFVNDGS